MATYDGLSPDLARLLNTAESAVQVVGLKCAAEVTAARLLATLDADRADALDNELDATACDLGKARELLAESLPFLADLAGSVPDSPAFGPVRDLIARVVAHLDATSSSAKAREV